MFKHIQSMMYTTRIVNLMSTMQLSLTGQRYYNLELKKSSKNSKPKGEEDNVLSQLLKDVGSDNEEGGEEEGKQEEAK